MSRIAASSTDYGMHFKCPYSEYLYKYEGGTGVIPAGEGSATIFGTALHGAVERMLITSHDLLPQPRIVYAIPDTEVTPDGLKRSEELQWLMYGLLYSFHTHHLKEFLDKYEVVGHEQEYVLQLAEDVYWPCRPDLVLRRRNDSAYFNGNIKSMSYIRDLGSLYEFSIQMLMEAQAIRQHQQLTTQGTIILAFNKGVKGKLTKRDKEQNKTGYRMESPFTYVWWKKGTYSFEWSYGAEKMGVWTFNSTPAEWVAKIPPDIVKAQVVITEPVNHNAKVRYEEVIKDIVFVERCCREGKAPRAYDSCNSYGTYNHPCVYKTWCWGTPQERNELYIPRTSNHPFEETLRSLNEEEL